MWAGGVQQNGILQSRKPCYSYVQKCLQHLVGCLYSSVGSLIVLLLHLVQCGSLFFPELDNSANGNGKNSVDGVPHSRKEERETRLGVVHTREKACFFIKCIIIVFFTKKYIEKTGSFFKVFPFFYAFFLFSTIILRNIKILAGENDPMVHFIMFFNK